MILEPPAALLPDFQDPGPKYSLFDILFSKVGCSKAACATSLREWE